MAVSGLTSGNTALQSSHGAQPFVISQALPEPNTQNVNRKNSASKIKVIPKINLQTHEREATYGNFYTGIAFNTIGVVAGTGGYALKQLLKAKKIDKFDGLLDTVIKFADDNPISKNLFRFEYDHALNDEYNSATLKFNVHALKEIPKEAREKILDEIEAILKRKNRGPDFLAAIVQLKVLKGILNSKKSNNEITRKMEFRLVCNPSKAKDGWDIRARIHFSQVVPFKFKMDNPLFKGNMSGVYFISPSFYRKGELRLVHGFELNFPTALGHNSFVPVGFSNSVQSNIIYKRKKVPNGYHYGLEVSEKGHVSFMPFPKDIEDCFKAINMGALEGAKDSTRPVITLEKFMGQKFKDEIPQRIVDDTKVTMARLAAGHSLKEVLNAAAPHVNKVVNARLTQVTTTAAIDGTVWTASKALPTVAKVLPGLAAKAAPWIVGAAEYSNLIGWGIAALSFVKGSYDDDQEKKRKYKYALDNLVKAGAYAPDKGIDASVRAITKYTQTSIVNKLIKYPVGSITKLMCDVVDQAYAQKKIKDPQALRAQWVQGLSYMGKTKTDTYLGRMIAAGVLGRTDLVEKNSNLLSKLISQDDFISMYTTMTGYASRHSKTLVDVATSAKDAPVKILSAEGYSSFSAKFMDGKITASPSQTDDHRRSKWQITLKTGDGLTAVFYKTIDRQFKLTDLAQDSELKKTLETSVNAQRARFAKVPSNIKPFKGTLYGNPVTAVPLYIKDGATMWKVTAKSKSGVSATVYETLGLDYHSDYQFSNDDLQPGHIFRAKLEAKMRGSEY